VRAPVGTGALALADALAGAALMLEVGVDDFGAVGTAPAGGGVFGIASAAGAAGAAALGAAANAAAPPAGAPPKINIKYCSF